MTITQKKLLREFEPIFYPSSIAVVGASHDKRKAGYSWLKALIASGFGGDLYPVNTGGGELLGLRVYPNLREIPGAVDYVIVTIPRTAVPDLLDDCAAKKIKAVHFFTAGFGEADDSIGCELEEEMARKVRQGGFHVIGPNCIGPYCPESKVPYGFGKELGDIGSVGFVSQSGGVGGKLVELATARNLKYSKGISFGNGVDLDGVDFLEYMAADPGISVIGAYFEGTRDGRRLFSAMKDATKVKPLVMWKGGRTEVGAAAAKSHTGSLASPAATWSAALRQAGVIEVYSLEELADTLLIFQQLQQWQGNGVAVVGGLANGGGGISVSAGDTCAEAGLHVPSLSPISKQQLVDLLGLVGSILHNPVDVSQSGSSPAVIHKAIEIILADPSVDLIIVQEDVGITLGIIPWEHLEAINNAFMRFRGSQQKPIVFVLPPGIAESERLAIEHKLAQASIPVFPTMERAAKAIVNLSRYSSFLASIASQ